MIASPTPVWSDRRLVTACLRHNEKAWKALVDKYKNLVYAIIVRYGVSDADAGDVFQSVWVDVCNDLGDGSVCVNACPSGWVGYSSPGCMDPEAEGSCADLIDQPFASTACCCATPA